MIYTAIAGEKDAPRDDIKVFTTDMFVSPRMNAKIFKILPHLFMNDEYSVWVDGNMTPKLTEQEYIAFLGDNDIAVMNHPERQCLYDEGKFCEIKGKDIAEKIEPQLHRYHQEGYPRNNGLYACGFIVRRHTPKMKRLCEQWWAEICAGSSRDQISFPYVFREGVSIIPGNPWVNTLYDFKSHTC